MAHFYFDGILYGINSAALAAIEQARGDAQKIHAVLHFCEKTGKAQLLSRAA
jgi:hypothetical protein